MLQFCGIRRRKTVARLLWEFRYKNSSNLERQTLYENIARRY
jgi:hypothetical protein